jgi:hypothetical protein
LRAVSNQSGGLALPEIFWATSSNEASSALASVPGPSR